MSGSQELLRLATWYREFAERAGEPWIWEARQRRADELEEEAARLEANPIQIEELRSRPKL